MRKISKPAELDEAEIKTRFLAGQAASTIALSQGGDRYKQIRTFIAIHAQDWLKEAGTIGAQSDDRKTIIRRIVMSETGNRRIVPVSLPYNTMHRLALQEAAHA